jgi:hypothetical protein
MSRWNGGVVSATAATVPAAAAGDGGVVVHLRVLNTQCVRLS